MIRLSSHDSAIFSAGGEIKFETEIRGRIEVGLRPLRTGVGKPIVWETCFQSCVVEASVW